MFFNGDKRFLKIIPVFLFISFIASAQKVVVDDLVKGKWFVEGNLQDSVVKLTRKRNPSSPYRVYTFATGTVLHRCDSIYQSAFDDTGNEVRINKLDCNSPATYGLKNLIMYISTGKSSHYFIVEAKKGGGMYTLRRTKAEYYNQP